MIVLLSPHSMVNAFASDESVNLRHKEKIVFRKDWARLQVVVFQLIQPQIINLKLYPESLYIVIAPQPIIIIVISRVRHFSGNHVRPPGNKNPLTELSLI